MSEPETPPTSGHDPDKDVLLDARRIRGIAHPLRVRILDLLRRGGPATATGLAERLGQSSGATSYHLRQLATYGFVVEDPDRGTARERWWKAVHRSTVLNDSSQVDPADAETYLHAVVDATADRGHRFVNELYALPEEWRGAFTLNNVSLRLTPEESLRLIEEVTAVLDRYRHFDAPDAPAGAEHVATTFNLLPLAGDAR
ncbi:winged helix-turn-helix domain-containing protein [Phytomonospora endophytica]|uniref:DNA-binding transcriptional ArsR family regulator n=1 Tax=Phytomonospora endophytica TaxID=714109 RepID=A0A841FIN8_9ACTN|nr:winged helix-turn-helix domain-containing protein [Phytomonospora endophytica]MBB6037201.1 DNA-binding transcriptional ArsR family regulator [Phytomonospora endophytica]